MRGEEAVSQGYKQVYIKGNSNSVNLKFPKGFFRIRFPGAEPIVIGHDYLKEFYSASADELSSRQSLAESVQLRYTFGKDVAEQDYHMELARSKFKKQLPDLLPAMVDEVIAAIRDEIPDSPGL